MTMQERCAPEVTFDCGREFDPAKVLLAILCHCGAKSISAQHEYWCPVACRERRAQRKSIVQSRSEYIEFDRTINGLLNKELDHSISDETERGTYLVGVV